MIRFFPCLTCILVVLVAGCGGETVDVDKMVERDGVWYKPNSDSPFSGVLIDSYPNGQKKFEAKVYRGKQHGKQTHWFENGQVQEYSYFEEGNKNGKIDIWHENGQKAMEGEIKYGKITDDTKTWDFNGNVIK